MEAKTAARNVKRKAKPVEKRGWYVIAYDGGSHVWVELVVDEGLTYDGARGRRAEAKQLAERLVLPEDES